MRSRAFQQNPILNFGKIEPSVFPQNPFVIMMIEFFRRRLHPYSARVGLDYWWAYFKLNDLIQLCQSIAVIWKSDTPSQDVLRTIYYYYNILLNIWDYKFKMWILRPTWPTWRQLIQQLFQKLSATFSKTLRQFWPTHKRE